MRCKIIIYSLLIAAIAFLAGGCTRNNGDIGPIFGKWKVESIETEGIGDAPEYEGNIFLAFQNSVVMVQTVLPLHEYVECFGNFTLTSETLHLVFPDESFTLPPQLMLPRDAELKVAELDGKRMQLIYNPSPEQRIIYRLKKW